MSPRHPRLSETELEVLKGLWELGTATVRELNEHFERQGRRWAYTTMLTLLTRLEAKGCAESESAGVAHVYRPTVSRDDLVSRQLTDLADDLCDGAASPLVKALVAGHRFSAEELAHFRRLLDEAGERPPPKGRRKKQ